MSSPRAAAPRGRVLRRLAHRRRHVEGARGGVVGAGGRPEQGRGAEWCVGPLAAFQENGRSPTRSSCLTRRSVWSQLCPGRRFDTVT